MRFATFSCLKYSAKRFRLLNSDYSSKMAAAQLITLSRLLL